MQWTQAHNWQWLVLENPVPLSITFATAGLLLLWHGLRRRDRKARRIAPVLLLLAVGVWCLALNVTTPREVVRDRAKQLVNLTAPLNRAALHGFFDEAAVLMTGPGTQSPLSAERLASNVLGWRIDGHWIKSINVTMLKGHRATTLIRLRTSLASQWGDRPIHTDWELTWVKRIDGTWRIEKAVWLKLNGKPPVSSLIQ